MAAFALEGGEHVIHRERVRNVRDNKVACELILTDRRIVLTATEIKPNAWIFFGALGGLFGALVNHRKAHVSHEIRRERYGAVERSEKRDLKVSSTGVGYGVVWFEIASKHADEWRDRIHAWAAGNTPAPLPPAKIVAR